jgi:hypothetical protein
VGRCSRIYAVLEELQMQMQRFILTGIYAANTGFTSTSLYALLVSRYKNYYSQAIETRWKSDL